MPTEASKLTIRASDGGPTMLYSLPPGKGPLQLGVHLPVFWARQTYTVRLLKGDSADPTELSTVQVQADWPAQAVDQSGFLAPELYEKWGDERSDWPSAVRWAVLGIAACYAILLAVQPVGAASHRARSLIGVSVLGVAVVLVLWLLPTATTRVVPTDYEAVPAVAQGGSFPSLSTYMIRRGEAVADEDTDADLPRFPAKAKLVTTQRTRRLFLRGQLWIPLYRNVQHLRDDTSVVAPGGGVWVAVKPGQPRLLIERY